MQQGRNIKKSMRDKVVSLFEAPPVESGFSVFNVYGESEYRDNTFIPPQQTAFVYIISSRILPTDAAKYPVIIIDVPNRRRQSGEIGNRSGRDVTIDLDCFGRNSAESSDIADFIADYVGSTLPIRDYAAANPTGTVVENAPILEPIEVDAMAIEQQSVEFSGAVLAWERVRMKIMTLT